MKGKYIQRYLSGFTLIELIVALAVLGILTTVAMPSFVQLMSSSRATQITNDLVTALHAARSEAVKRNARVTVCHSTNGSLCTSSGKWADGWISFIDADNSGTRQISETLLLSHEKADDSFTLDIGAASIPIKDYISFGSDGMARTTIGVLQSGKLQLRNATTGVGRDITISGGSIKVKEVHS